MKTLFFLSGILSIFSYFLYPLILKAIPPRRSLSHGEGVASPSPQPMVTLIITAHNEERRIKDKLLNTIDILYPLESLDVIVASDCSSDATDEIVQSYADRGIRLVRAQERKGKEFAQLCAIREARGDILVFSDVATKIGPDALKQIVQVFADPSIGAISSEDRFVSRDGRVVGEGAYVKYEMWLRRLESERAGLVGLSGSFFAARREVCEQWDIQSPSDFNTALNCAKAGMIAISCPAIVGMYSDVKDPQLEYRRKLRTIIRGMTAIYRHPEVLNPFKLGLFSFQVWSHKILRWAVPWFMLLFFASSLWLSSSHIFFAFMLVAQLLFYCVVLLAHYVPRIREHTLVKIPYFFVQVNLAIAAATIKFFCGQRMTTWVPSER